ncbi:hypothetical protein ACFP51_09645 [Streptomyces pratens]|uniref:Uncharacterized protein n=1 Tax=Streptomyces pratens TaxID=887456 RepID=A0ABW1LYR1_9ACTN
MTEAPASQAPENALTFTFPGSQAQANALNRDLAEWVNATDQLGGRANLRTAPPAPGEQGDVATAVDIINASAAMIAAVTNTFFLWLQQRRPTYRRIEFEVVRPDGTRVSAAVDDEAQLPAVMNQLAGFVTASPEAGE